ncbi:MAG: cytochrome c oxidase subunit II [Acidobacteriota bacterium]|nr:cytochrome c oxidase subunit II [Acidobacteriota bacterium]
MKRLLWPAALMLAGCAGRQQSAVDAAGLQAGKIETLWWFFLWLMTAIFLSVMAVLLLALTRRHRGIEQEPLEATHRPPEQTERKLTRVVTAASVVTVLILLGLIIVSIATGKSISRLGETKNGMVVEVTGNQWWWYVRYQNDQASRTVVTANEIHIPVGRPVMIRGTSNDVIHSFWVPNLHGKRDLIPSRVTTEWIQADRPGRYRGQCAEFCGAQHAHMALWVVAETPSQFAKWMDNQRQPAAAPSNAIRQRGQDIFLNNACVFCHAVSGTRAMGQTGPDLTHFGSRSTLAAGTLPNTKGNLGGWIADPQNIKPGNHMATVPLKSEEVEPLLDYLESLQ